MCVQKGSQMPKTAYHLHQEGTQVTRKELLFQLIASDYQLKIEYPVSFHHNTIRMIKRNYSDIPSYISFENNQINKEFESSIKL